jgi:2-aminoethylphosphonate-pyruvate transaminase
MEINGKIYPDVKRNVLMNPGPATTTDTVKYAQVVPDICPREKEFCDIMHQISLDLVKIVHGDPKKFVGVLFCGSGTMNIDVTISSLVPADKKILIINNGSYSARAVEVAKAYHVDHTELQLPIDRPIDVMKVREALDADPSIAVVYCCMHETGTGVLNPIREIGAAAHEHGCTMISDTTSAYAMIPIDIEKDNQDFIMASAQKGLQSMTGLSFIVGRESIIDASKDYPVRSYYTNLYMQHSFIREHGEMRFTPPVQTIYATRQAILEYFAEGEQAKWERHQSVWAELYKGLEELGFHMAIKKEYQSRLVISVLCPDDPAFSFEAMHDYPYQRGFTVYSGKVAGIPMFRLCALGAINPQDIRDFFVQLKGYMKEAGMKIPCMYKD